MDFHFGTIFASIRIARMCDGITGENAMKTLAALATTLLFSTLCASASAGTWTESGDAGNTPGTAQNSTGAGTLTTIYGSLNVATDTDVYKIYISDTASFSITMVGTALSGDNDTELYVLDSLGHLLFSDDDGGPGWLSQLNAGQFSANAAGYYLVAYNLFSSSPIGNPVTGWTVNPVPAQTGAVQLNFTSAQFSKQVPEPGSVALLAIALAGLGVARMRLVRHQT